MLGLKLNHVSKRGHMSLLKTFIQKEAMVESLRNNFPNEICMHEKGRYTDEPLFV